MSWLILFLAALCEIGWAAGLKATHGFTKLLPTVLVAASMLASIILLGIATKQLPIGTAYAVWTGIGALGVATIGILFLCESASAPRLACMAMIAAGVVGLKFFSGE